MALPGDRRMPLRMRKRLAPYQSRQRQAWPAHFLFLGTLTAATLSFTSPTNLSNAIAKNQTSTLSFTGIVNKAITTGLVGAVLGFVGTVTKMTGLHQIGGLSFTGTGPSFLINKSLTAVLTFSGSALRVISKGIASGLSFSGTVLKSTAYHLTGSSSFSGNVTKQTAFHQTAILSFTGTFLKLTLKNIIGSLLFSGVTNKLTTKTLVGSLNFVGSLGISKIFIRAFTAGLSFTGSQTKSIRTGFAASLSFTGNFLGSKLPKMISFAASMTAKATVGSIHWYFGIFKELSIGSFRALSRAINNFLTQKQD